MTVKSDQRHVFGHDSGIWRGAVAWEQRGDRARVWRLLPERAERAHAPDLIDKAGAAAGVRADLRTDAARLELDASFDYEEPGTLDVVLDGSLHERLTLTPGESRLRVDLPEGEHNVSVWLPQVGHLWLSPLRLVGATTAGVLPAGPVRWIAYGSSITQCRAAFGPSQTWPAVAAQTLGWDLLCLGFGGQCHLDPIAWRTIASQQAEVISLCLGINIQGASSFNERSFAAHASEFIEQVRTAHPEATIAVITPIGSPEREAAPNAVGLSLEAIREQLGAVVKVAGRADDRLHLIDGLEILGLDEAHLLHDGLHPDGDGYALMGQRLAARLGALHGAAELA